MLWATSGALWTCKLAAVPQKVGALDAFREPFGTTWQILAAILDPAGSQRDPKITIFWQQISKKTKKTNPKMPENTLNLS